MPYRYRKLYVYLPLAAYRLGVAYRLPQYQYLGAAYCDPEAVGKTCWNVFFTKWHQNRDLSLRIGVPETS